MLCLNKHLTSFCARDANENPLPVSCKDWSGQARPDCIFGGKRPKDKNEPTHNALPRNSS